MSTNGLKKIYEKIPKGIKYAFSPIFISLMVKNKEFIKTWNDLDYFEGLSVERQKEVQLNRLKEILIYAYENVSYYKAGARTPFLSENGYKRFKG